MRPILRPLPPRGSPSLGRAVAMKTRTLLALSLLPFVAVACGGGGGGGSSSNKSKPKGPRPARWAFAASVGDSTISAFAVDAESGRLVFRGAYSDPLSFTGPQGVTAHPTQPFLYAPNLRDASKPSDVSVFRIDPDTGQLTAGVPAPIGVGPHSMRLSPDGRTAYVTNNGTDDVHVFRVDQKQGDLTPLGVVSAGDGPWDLTVDPKGRFVFVANRNDATLSVFKVDDTGGLKAPGKVFNLNSAQPYAMSVDTKGRFLLATAQNFKLLLSFRIDGKTGDLTTEDVESIGGSPSAVAFHPSGEVFYVASRDDDTVVPFPFDPATGEIGAPGAPIDAGTNPNGITIDERGTFAYVAYDGTNEVVVLDLTDPLVPTVAGAFRGRRVTRLVGLSHGSTALEPRGDALFVLNNEGGGAGSVSAFDLDEATGSATRVGPDTLTGNDASSMVVDPFGRFVWVALRGDDAVQGFTIAPTGDLVPIGPPEPVAADPEALALDPTGSYLYVTSGSTDVVESYAVQVGQGGLTKVDEQATLSQPGAVAVDPTGQVVYVANRGSAQVTGYRVKDGAFLSTVQAGAFTPNYTPTALAFSAGGDQLYVTLEDAVLLDLVLAYSIDPVQGDLTLNAPGGGAEHVPTGFAVHPLLPRGYAALSEPAGVGGVGLYGLDASGRALFDSTLAVGLNPIALALDPSGSFLYVANQGGDDVTVFTLDAGGTPTAQGVVQVGVEPADLALLPAFD